MRRFEFAIETVAVFLADELLEPKDTVVAEASRCM